MKGFRNSLKLWKISIPKQIPGFFLGPSWDWLEQLLQLPIVSMYGIYTYMYACFLWYINSTLVCHFIPVGPPVGWDSWFFCLLLFLGKTMCRFTRKKPVKISKWFPCAILWLPADASPRIFSSLPFGYIAFLAPQKIRWDIFLRM